MIGRVKVNRMPDVGRDDFKVSARMATRAFIDRIGAEVIRSAEAQIDKEHMNVDGMTGFFFYKEQLASQPTARFPLPIPAPDHATGR